MVRVIKRYESRKLYDTEESRYVSLDEIAEFVRQGQEVQVVDNGSGEDVTAQTLTQVILEEGRSGRGELPTELLHELVRRGEKALANGVEQAKQGVNRLVEASFDRLGPVKQARAEMDVLRARLEDLEASLASLATQPARPARAAAKPRKKTATRKKTTRKKATAKKTAKRTTKKN